MQAHTLKPKHQQKTKKRIGRGGKKGTTSGRGTKGQKSRAGHKIRPAERDYIKRLPKLRGYRFKSVSFRPAVINIRELNKAFANGEKVNPRILVQKKLIRSQSGVAPRVKVLGDGDITKKITIYDCDVSASAKIKIEKAGGSVVELAS